MGNLPINMSRLTAKKQTKNKIKTNPEMASLMESFNNYNQTLIEDVTPVLIADYTMRIVAILVHLLYFLSIIYLKALQKLSMMLLHNVNLVSLLYCLHYGSYIGSFTNQIGYAGFANFLCHLSEITWAALKFLRMYSLVLLTGSRYLAVKKPMVYKELTSSRKKIASLIALVWLFSFLISLALKFTFQTDYLLFYCLDGYSNLYTVTVLYTCTSIVLAFLIPNIINVVIYVIIVRKLLEMSANLNISIQTSQQLNIESSRVSNRDGVLSIVKDLRFKRPSVSRQLPLTLPATLRRNQRDRDRIVQIIAINSLHIIVTFLSIFVNMQTRLIIYEDFMFMINDMMYVRPAVRIFFLIGQSLIPIITIYYIFKIR